MLRLVVLATALAAAGAAGAAQSRTQTDTRCPDGWNNDRETYCDTREETLSGGAPLDVDAGSNGGIRVRGWDRNDVRLVTRVTAYAETMADARRIANDVRVETAAGRIRATGPTTRSREHWGVSFEIDVPRDARLNLTTLNGGIAIAEFRGTASFRATNGGVALDNVAGDIRGGTTNGGLKISLAGDRWDGEGLDVETRNGGVHMSLPERYSAELETGTVNGRVRIDFPVMVQGTIGRDIRTRLGSGGARIRAITRNGAVTIERQ